MGTLQQKVEGLKKRLERLPVEYTFARRNVKREIEKIEALIRRQKV
jgi:hypothetical protein